MPQTNLLETANDIERLIANARTDLAQGRSVDLLPIERRVGVIYSEVSESLSAAGPERVALLLRLNALMPELTALEADLTSAHPTSVG